MRISDWSSDVCSSDLAIGAGRRVDQLTRTVRADVVEGLELIRRGADDDDRIATDLVGEKITDVRNLLDTAGVLPRSEEHTSELQSLMRISYAVFCLKKKKKIKITTERQKTQRHSNRDTINNLTRHKQYKNNH